MTEKEDYEEIIAGRIADIESRIEYLGSEQDRLNDLNRIIDRLSEVGGVSVSQTPYEEDNIVAIQVQATVDSLGYDCVEKLLSTADRNGEVRTDERDDGQYTVNGVVLVWNDSF